MKDPIPNHIAGRHHQIRPGEIDAPHRWHDCGDFPLESGETIRDFGISYVEHGIPDPEGMKTVLALTAIGSTHHRLDFLIGPGRALDPTRSRIVVVDAIGNGLSASPSNSRRQPGPDFPRFGIRDMVAAQHLLVTQVLGLRRIFAVIGISMGGMQALQWGVSHPSFLDKLIAITPMARTPPWSRAVNQAARRALVSDPSFAEGRYSDQPERGWRDWAVIMRLLATRTPQALEGMGNIDDWLDREVRNILADGMDANDYIAQSHAYDAHDVGGTPGFGGDTRAALATIRAPTLIAAPPLDLYNPVEAARWAAAAIRAARYAEIPSPSGHQAATAGDLAAAAFLNAQIPAFLSAQ